MRNRPAIILVLLAIVAVVFVQFLVAVGGDSSPPAQTARTEAPSVSQPVAGASSSREQSPDYGGLTPAEFYARQDAAEAAEELAVRERNQGVRPPAEFDGLEGVSPWGVYDELDPPPEEDPVQAEVPEETVDPSEDDAALSEQETELSEEEQAGQETVEENPDSE